MKILQGKILSMVISKIYQLILEIKLIKILAGLSDLIFDGEVVINHFR